MQAKRLLNHVKDQITNASCRTCANTPTNETEQTRLQTKEQKEIQLAIAHRLEHGDLGLAARKQNLHGIDNTNTTNEQGEETSNGEKILYALSGCLLLLQSIGGRLCRG